MGWEIPYSENLEHNSSQSPDCSFCCCCLFVCEMEKQILKCIHECKGSRNEESILPSRIIIYYIQKYNGKHQEGESGVEINRKKKTHSLEMDPSTYEHLVY